jgi:hypothetical protein
MKAKTVLKLCLKVSDRFTATLERNGALIGDVYDDYVPGFMPGEHYGDYVLLDIDVATGRILNWNKPTKADLDKMFPPST